MEMLSYDTAKRLKYAGFPQISHPRFGQGFWYSEDGGEGVFVPSLEFLIESCNGRFSALLLGPSNSHGIIYRAMENFYLISPEPSRTFHDFFKGKFGEGDSASEALADLWFNLNRK